MWVSGRLTLCVGQWEIVSCTTGQFFLIRLYYHKMILNIVYYPVHHTQLSTMSSRNKDTHKPIGLCSPGTTGKAVSTCSLTTSAWNSGISRGRGGNTIRRGTTNVTASHMVAPGKSCTASWRRHQVGLLVCRHAHPRAPGSSRCILPL